MSKNTALMLVVGFVAGCGAAVAAPLIIPPAHAQTTQRWETLCARPDFRADYPAGFMAVGNAAGREGWEPFSLASAGSEGSVICFKRPAP